MNTNDQTSNNGAQIPLIFQNQPMIKTIEFDLRTLPKTRDIDQLRRLSKFLDKCNIFKNIEDEEKKRELCNCLQLIECYENEVICKQNEIGTTFYIILKGTVNGYVNRQLDSKRPKKATAVIDDSVFKLQNSKKFHDEEYIFSLRAGQDFGDIALLSESCTRTATIRAGSDDTKLIQLSKEHFLEFINEYKTESVTKTMNLFNKCLLLKGISQRSKKVLASKSYDSKYPANTVLLRQGERTYNIFFVYKGQISVIRRVNPKELENAPNELFKKKSKELPETVLLRIETLRKKFKKELKKLNFF